MTSREGVPAVFAGGIHDRVPAWLGASPSRDCLLPETKVENVFAPYETVREFGKS